MTEMKQKAAMKAYVKQFRKDNSKERYCDQALFELLTDEDGLSPGEAIKLLNDVDDDDDDEERR